jgi:SAM-dependent methyltransferase
LRPVGYDGYSEAQPSDNSYDSGTMSRPSGLSPTSLIGGSATRLWRHIPGDHRRRSARECYDVFWDDDHQFGMVYPRATDARETLAYYETTDSAPYYTHVRLGGGPSLTAPSRFLSRVLFHLAWRADPIPREIHDEIRRRYAGRRFSILDAGCGAGESLAHCRDLGHKAVGFEPDRTSRELAQAQGLEVYNGTCEQIPSVIRDRLFDVIICRHALHHVIAPELCLRNLADRLVRGGHLICEVPNQRCAVAQWSGIAWSALDVPRQLNVFTAKSLTHMIEQASLRVEEVQWSRYCNQFHSQAIAHERGKYDFFMERGSGRDSLPVKPTLLSRYGLLARTRFARPESKFAALRVVAQKP